MTTDRCPTCDREACPSFALRDLPVTHVKVCADDDCHAHRANWRAKFFAAEADAARWRKVAPLIEAMREAAKVAHHDYATEDDATVGFRVTGHELIDAVTNLLAATKEP